MTTKDKRQIVRKLLANNNVDKRCDCCNSKMMLNPRREGWLICRECAYEISLFNTRGLEKLMDADATNPILFRVGEDAEPTLEEQEAQELKKRGYRVQNIRRVG